MSVALFLLALSTCTSTLILLYLANKMRQRFGKLDRNLGKQPKQIDALSDKLALLDSLLTSANKDLSSRIDRIEKRHQQSTKELTDLLKSREQQQKKAILELSTTITDGQLEIGYLNSFNVLPLKYPLFFGRWSIDGFTAKCIVDTLRELRPKVVVELGSGSSTVLIAATLQTLRLTQTRHIAVDHLEEFLNITRENVALQGFAQKTEFWHCPLVPPVNENDPSWYGGLPDKLTNIKIDLLLVDGPPGSIHPEIRRPAMDVLAPYLSENAVIILDDTSRPDEAHILELWREKYPFLEIETSRRGKGCAKVRLKSPSPTSAPPEGTDSQ